MAESAATAPATPSISVQIGFDVAGVAQNIGSDYSAITWTDVTAYVRPDPPVTFSRGRAEAGQSAAAGQLQVTLLNDTGDFTPGDNGGAYGAIHTRMPIRVRGDAGGYDTTYYSSEYATAESLWVGFVTDIDWSLDSGQPLVTFTASDIIAAAARTQCGPWLDRRLINVTSSGLAGYWPLTDPAPNGLGNSSQTTVPLLLGETLLSGLPDGAPLTATGVAEGNLSCNVPTGALSPDNQANIAFTPAPSATYPPPSGWAPRGKTLQTDVPLTSSLGLSVWFRVETIPADDSYLLAVHRPGTGGRYTTATVVLEGATLKMSLSDGASTVTLGTLTAATWTHLYLDATGGTTSAYLNGALVASGAATVTTTTHTLLIGGGTSNNYGGWEGQVAQVAVWDTSDTSRVAALVDKGTGEPVATARFADLVYVTPNPPGLSSWIATDAATTRAVSAQTTNGKSLLTLAQEVADAEQGSVVADRDGKLRLLSQRERAAAATPVLSLSAEADILSIDGLFGVDDADNLNQAQVTLQPSGRTFTALRTISPGVESTAVELWSSSDALARSLADAIANADTQTPRAPSLTVSVDWLAHADLATAAIPLELGDTITITGLPASAPASTLTVQVRSIAHTISRSGWQIQLDTDPPLRRGVLDDTGLGLLNDTAIVGV